MSATPGKVAYEAYVNDVANDAMAAPIWVQLDSAAQRGWEAVAKAVLDSAGGMVDLGGMDVEGFGE